MEIVYEVPVPEQFGCGGCPFITQDLKTLIYHVKEHTDSGSFYFCNDSNIAYPRYRQRPASTQTELLVEITSDDIIRTGNSLRFMPEVDTKGNQLLSGKERNEESIDGTIHEEPEIVTDDISEAIEEIEEYPDNEEKEEQPKQGGDPLVEIPLSYKFMSNPELLNVLLTQEPHQSDQTKEVKNYFVISTQHYKNSVVFEDGVTWDTKSRSSSKQIFSVGQDHSLSPVFLKGKYYCSQRKENGKKKYNIIQPQPTSILTFRKTTINLDGNEAYRRRITSVVKAPTSMQSLITKSVVEYYMDMSAVKKITGKDDAINVTLPDCAKLKEVLYPGYAQEIPDYATKTPKKSKQEVQMQTNKGTTTPASFSDVSESHVPNPLDETECIEEKPVIVKPIITSFSFVNPTDLLEIIVNDIDNRDGNSYRVFDSDSNGFQSIDEFGVWNMLYNSNTTYVVNEHDEFILARRENGKYYPEGHEKNSEKGGPPSPPATDLFVLQQCTFKLQNSDSFKKRETIVWSTPERFRNLLHRHALEYKSRACQIPRERKDKNGKTKLVGQHQYLHPCDRQYQTKLSSLVKAGMLNDDNFLFAPNNTYSFLSNKSILENLILDCTTSTSAVTSGRNYMVIKNEKADKKKNVYLRDGCVWDVRSSTCINQNFVIDEKNVLRGIYKKGDKYCLRKPGGRNQHGYKYLPLDPQPTDVITFHKYMTQLKSCPMYKKRVTSITEAPERLEFVKSKVLVEYYMCKSSLKTPLRLKKSHTLLDTSEENNSSNDSEDTIQERSQQRKRKFDEMTGEEDVNLEETDDVSPTGEAGSGGPDELVDNSEIHLPVTNLYLNRQKMWDIITSKTETPASSVMSATRDKDYIYVSCDGIHEGVNHQAYRDGLWWDTTTCAKNYVYYVLEGDELEKSVEKKGGLYCVRKQDKRKTVFVALKPQPKQIVTFMKIYFRHKTIPWYRKRLFSIYEAPEKFAFLKSRAIIEYCIEKSASYDSMLHDSLHSTRESPHQHSPESTLEDLDDEDLDAFDEEMEMGEVCEASPGKVKLTSPGKVKLTSPGKVKVTSPGKVKVTSPGKVKLTFPGKVKLTSPGKVKLTSPGKVKFSIYNKAYFSSPDYRSERLNRRLKQTPDETLEISEQRKGKVIAVKEESIESNPVASDGDNVLASSMMDSQSALDCLLAEDPVPSALYRLPHKSYVVVNQGEDFKGRQQILRDSYSWNWSTSTSQKHLYSITDDNKVTYIVKHNGKYCKKTYINNLKLQYVPLKPQPREVITIHRNFVKGEGASLCRRKTRVISDLERLSSLQSKVLVEYSTSAKGMYLPF